MKSRATKAVLDCMIYAQAMISRAGPSAACFEEIQSGRFDLIWSDYVLQEIRELPTKLPVRFNLTPERVETFIANVAPFARHLSDVPETYVNPFDLDDSHYVNLAVASGAELIASRDGDLLRLMDQKRSEGRDFTSRFPQLRILRPEELLRLVREN